MTSDGRHTFPTARRGYDPRAVDRHLATIARELASAPADDGPAVPLDGVQALLAGAHESAATLRRAAEEAGAALQAEAAAEAAEAVERADANGAERIAVVAAARAALLARLEDLDRDADELVAALHAAAERFQDGTAVLEVEGARLAATAGLGEAEVVEIELGPARRRAQRPPPRGESEPEPQRDEPEPERRAGESEPEPQRDEPEPERRAGKSEPKPKLRRANAEADRAGEPQPATPEPAPGGEAAAAAPPQDAEGAQLIALNMALDGASREATDRYLAENFELPDREKLLDEFYGS